jgi:hypothetical protein
MLSESTEARDGGRPRPEVCRQSKPEAMHAIAAMPRPRALTLAVSPAKLLVLASHLTARGSYEGYRLGRFFGFGFTLSGYCSKGRTSIKLLLWRERSGVWRHFGRSRFSRLIRPLYASSFLSRQVGRLDYFPALYRAAGRLGRSSIRWICFERTGSFGSGAGGSGSGFAAAVEGWLVLVPARLRPAARPIRAGCRTLEACSSRPRGRVRWRGGQAALFELSECRHRGIHLMLDCAQVTAKKIERVAFLAGLRPGLAAETDAVDALKPFGDPSHGWRFGC